MMKYVLSLKTECCKDITNLCEEDDEICFEPQNRMLQRYIVEGWRHMF